MYLISIYQLCIGIIATGYINGMSVQIPKFQLKLSPLVNNMAVSKTIETHALTKEMEKNGLTVYSLCVGEPDYAPPPIVLSATNEAAISGLTKYTSVNGEITLRKAISDDLFKRKGTKYLPEQIVVSNGAKQSVLQALMSVVSPGDEVIIPAPYWTSYPDMVKICQANPVIIDTYPQNNYILTSEALRNCLNSHPKISCIILCNPSNPTGSVASKEELFALSEVLNDFPKVTILSDEIYERLTYNGIKHVSFASISNSMYERTITINGFSKSHSMTGYRIGYSASSIEISKACSKLQSQITSCASSIGQYAATQALLADTNDWFNEQISNLEKKRDIAYTMISSIPNVICNKPNGAFYLLPDVSYYYNTITANNNIIKNSNDFSFYLLKEYQVAIVSGDSFGNDKCIRLSYATSVHIIIESLNRLKTFILSLKHIQ